MMDIGQLRLHPFTLMKHCEEASSAVCLCLNLSCCSTYQPASLRRRIAVWLLIKFFTGIISSTRVAYCLFDATCCSMLCLPLCSQGQPWFICRAYRERVTVWQKPLRFGEIGERKRWEIHFCKSFEPNWLRHTGREEKKAGELQKESRKWAQRHEAKDYTI